MIDQPKFARAGHPTDWLQPLRPNGPPAHVLLVDDDDGRAELTSAILSWHGFGRPDRCRTGDEALDLVAGSATLQLLILALPLPDDADRDVEGLLCRHRSTLRLARQGTVLPWELTNAHRYRGIAAFLDMAGSKGIARDIDGVLRSNWTVAHIMTSSIAPSTLTKGWAEAVYGARPGQKFVSQSKTTPR
jgi:CheY-like chemotaxis protein